MNILDITAKKRDGKALTKQEISFVIEKYMSSDIADYQMSALLMAIYLNGMTDEETIALTEAMIASGDIIDLSHISGIKADKHSTGGVGDKTTLVIVPILAASGIKMVKMSGRGLGFTGGTIDKLESIKGYRTSLSEYEIKNQLEKINAVMIGATAHVAPADKKIYALRDASATVESIPLIASSIMSKKIACGADVILIDIKVGSGAFMKNEADAQKLSKLLIKIGKHFNKRVDTIISSMDNVLGCAVGNLLEVEEAIDTLRCEGPSDLKELCLEISQKIMDLAEISENAKEILSSGRAMAKFNEIINAQGGDLTSLKRRAKYSYNLTGSSSGTITKIDVQEVGLVASMLGAGRVKKDDVISYTAGIVIHKKLGEAIASGEILATLFTDNEKSIESAAKRLSLSYTVGA